VTVAEITEKQCVTERYSHRKVKIRLMQQHCTAISATAQFMLYNLMSYFQTPTIKTDITNINYEYYSTYATLHNGYFQ